MRTLIAVTAAVALAGGAAEAKPGDKVVTEAKRRFEQGNKQYAKGNYEQALRLYVAAYELLPSPDILFNVGLAKEKVLDYEGCALSFRQYLSDTPESDPARERATQRLTGCRERARIPVKVSSIPPGAAISMGEGDAAMFRGRTPAEFELAPGSYVIGVELPGYVALTQTLTVDVGQRPEIDFPLEKLSTLTIEADVAGASVAIDGDAPEAAPIKRELRAGLYKVRVFKDGHKEVQREVRIDPGEQSTLMVSLPTLPVLRSLAIEANTDATVTLDGESLGTAPVEHSANTGMHRVVVRAPGHLPFARSIELRADRDTRLLVTLTPERSTTERRVLWGLWGAAGAAAAGAAVYGLLALDDQSDFDAVPSLDLADQGNRRAHRADFLWGTAAVFAGTAVLYHYITRPGPSRGEER